MSDDGNFTILQDMYKKEGSDEEVEGLTVIVDGIMQQVFDKVKEKRAYETYSEVLRDVIIEGVNNIITDE